MTEHRQIAVFVAVDVERPNAARLLAGIRAAGVVVGIRPVVEHLPGHLRPQTAFTALEDDHLMTLIVEQHHLVATVARQVERIHAMQHGVFERGPPDVGVDRLLEVQFTRPTRTEARDAIRANKNKPQHGIVEQRAPTG